MAHVKVAFTAMAGNAVDFDFLAKMTQAIAKDLDALKAIASREFPALMAAMESIDDALFRITPDGQTAPPTIDSIALAQAFLAEERNSAQEFLRREARRQHKESMFREAFCIPASLIYEVLIAPLEKEGQPFAALSVQERQTIWSNAIERFIAAGWTVYRTQSWEESTCSPSREPLRKLHEIMLSSTALTQQTLEVIDAVHQWYSATLYPSLYPMVLYPHKTVELNTEAASEGLRYPRLSMELVEVTHAGDIPEEWKQPLVAVRETA